jgi:hypothetical protein
VSDLRRYASNYKHAESTHASSCTVHTSNLEDDGGSPTKAAFAFRASVQPTAHDYARRDREMSVLEGDDAEPKDGELSSAESNKSAESVGMASSQLRRRGGICARRTPHRALSEATTAATTMEADRLSAALGPTLHGPCYFCPGSGENGVGGRHAPYEHKDTSNRSSQSSSVHCKQVQS